MSEKRIYISGMHSGQNPSAGVGIARCLKKAFPKIKLIAVDHWQGSSGLHHEVIDDILLLPQWKQINSQRHSRFLKETLDAGNIWISGLDVEVYWIAQNFGGHINLFAPTGTALEMTAKPSVKALSELNFRVPDFISAFESDSELHSFLRHNSWQCWLKGPYHDAKRISNWDSFLRLRDQMQKDWKTKRLFIQKNIVGNEESICFSAHNGKLTAAIHMQKRIITPEGKTWAGQINPLSSEFLDSFSEIIRGLEWSGGGEIEFTRDVDGEKWLIECNPRFPAWIYGAALAGVNLPAKMVAAAWNLDVTDNLQSYPCFTRVVQEIPAKEIIGLPMPPDPSLLAWSSDGGKGKGGASPALLMPRLRDTMTQQYLEAEDENEDSATDDSNDNAALISQHSYESPLYLVEISNLAKNFSEETPSRVHLNQWTQSCFESLLKSIRSSHSVPEIRIGYSVKTSPTAEHLKHAQSCGFLTECISQKEIERALSIGIPSHEILLNGPGKFWPITKPPITGLRMLFCDSVEEFNRVIQIPNISAVLGFRIQIPKLNSRFGVPVDKVENFEGVIQAIKKLKANQELGFHFHMPSWAIGLARWKEAVHSLITWCQAVEQLTNCPVRHLDMGGGFFPTDLERLDFKWLQQTIREFLPSVKSIYFEPGRSLTQEGEVLFSRVLDIRRTKENKVGEVVVDACIAELPLIDSYAHRLFFKSTSQTEVVPLYKGDTKILGRICMENDILSKGVAIPLNVEIGDLVIFGDAGAYERTMSYDFGRG